MHDEKLVSSTTCACKVMSQNTTNLPSDSLPPRSRSLAGPKKLTSQPKQSAALYAQDKKQKNFVDGEDKPVT